MKKVVYKGHNYLINHLYSDNQYGTRRVYHILTNNQRYACGIMNEVVGYPNVEAKTKHDLAYKQNPTMDNAFKPYYKCEFVQDDLYEKLCPIDTKDFHVDTDSYYIFEYIRPYDD